MDKKGDRPGGGPVSLPQAGAPPAKAAVDFSWIRAAVGYLALGVLVTWPLVFHLRTCLGGLLGVEDLQGTLAQYWWWKQDAARVLAQYSGYSPWMAGLWLPSFLDDFFSFPLRFYFGNFLDFFWDWPVEVLVGFPAFYNLKLILVLAANGLAAYALVRDRVRDTPAAFAAGALYACSPFFIANLAGSRMLPALAYWPPLVMLFFLRFLDDHRWRNAAACGGLLALAAATHWFYGIFLVMWMPLALLFRRRNRSANRSALTLASGLLVMALVTWIVVFPFAFPYLVRAVQGRPLMETTWLTDFPALEDAGGVHPFKVMGVIRDSASLEYLLGSPYEYGVPVLITLLALLPLLWRRFRPVLWMWTLGLFYLLSLGPYLKWLDQPLLAWGHAIRLPYVLCFKYLPFFSRLNWPSRASQMVLLALAVLVGINLAWMRQNLQKSGVAVGWKRSLAAALPLLAIMGPMAEMVRHGQLPMLSSALVVPAIYNRLAQETGTGIVEAPPNGFDQNNFYIDYDLFNLKFAQTLHQRKFLWEERDYHQALAPDEKELISAAGLMGNSFTRALLGLNYSPLTRFRFEQKDLDALKSRGYRYLILREKNFHNIGGDPRLAPRRGRSPDEARRLFRRAAAGLEAQFGPPLAGFEDWLWTGTSRYPPSHFTFRKYVLGRYPVLVFQLDGGRASP